MWVVFEQKYVNLRYFSIMHPLCECSYKPMRGNYIDFSKSKN